MKKEGGDNGGETLTLLREELRICRGENEKLLKELIVSRQQNRYLKEAIHQKKVKINLAIDKYEKYKTKYKDLMEHLNTISSDIYNQQQLEQRTRGREREGSSSLDTNINAGGRSPAQQQQEQQQQHPEHVTVGHLILQPKVDTTRTTPEDDGVGLGGDDDYYYHYEYDKSNKSKSKKKKKSKEKRRKRKLKKKEKWIDPLEEILCTNKWKEKRGEDPWEVRVENSEFLQQAKKINKNQQKQDQYAVEANGTIQTGKEVTVKPWGLYLTGQAEIDRALAEKQRQGEESEVENQQERRREIGW